VEVAESILPPLPSAWSSEKTEKLLKARTDAGDLDAKEQLTILVIAKVKRILWRLIEEWGCYNIDASERESLSQITAVTAVAGFDPKRGYLEPYVKLCVRKQLRAYIHGAARVNRGEPVPAIRRQEFSFRDPQMRAAFGALTIRQQEVLRLRYCLGYSARHIAGHLGLSVRRIHRIHARAIKNLRDWLMPLNVTVDSF